jgi:hypothetical protein
MQWLSLLSRVLDLGSGGQPLDPSMHEATRLSASTLIAMPRKTLPSNYTSQWPSGLM